MEATQISIQIKVQKVKNECEYIVNIYRNILNEIRISGNTDIKIENGYKIVIKYYMSQIVVYSGFLTHNKKMLERGIENFKTHSLELLELNQDNSEIFGIVDIKDAKEGFKNGVGLTENENASCNDEGYRIYAEEIKKLNNSFDNLNSWL